MLSILITACESSESENLIIDGKWKSSCIQIPDLSVFSSTPGSVIYTNTIYEYKNNIVITTNNTFSDSNCQIEESTDLSNLLSDESNIIAYSIGNKITTENGVDAHEITLSIQNGKVIDDIFSLIDNGNSLLFGKRTSQEYFACYLSSNNLPAPQSTLVDSAEECTRPVELDYESVLTRIYD